MEKGQVFEMDRWKDGTIESYKCVRICRRHIVVSLISDPKQQWCMPYDRLKDVNPKLKRFTDLIPSFFVKARGKTK